MIVALHKKSLAIQWASFHWNFIMRTARLRILCLFRPEHNELQPNKFKFRRDRARLPAKNQNKKHVVEGVD
jgi:hypothetical protein